MSRLAYSERILQPFGRFGTTFAAPLVFRVGKEGNWRGAKHT